MLDIRITKTAAPRPKPDPNSPLGFGSGGFTDHMFLMDYTEGRGWHDPRIVPYGPIELYPSALVLHYAQELFEGMKAFKNAKGTPLLFRPDRNAKRFQDSSRRICIPEIPEEDFIQAVSELVKLDADWISTAPRASLYLRPVVFATQPSVGVRISDSYIFAVICMPMLNAPLTADSKCWLESEYVRAVRGGTGNVKVGGNYTGTLLPSRQARERGYQQVLYLDGQEGRYIEEMSSSNVYFVKDGVFVTPSLEGSILPGITRDSLLALCRSYGIPCEERRISREELVEALRDGSLTECASIGTAGLMTPVGLIGCDEGDFTVGDGTPGPISRRLYDGINAIQRGEIVPPEGWIVEL